jgi:hypothetical protein
MPIPQNTFLFSEEYFRNFEKKGRVLSGSGRSDRSLEGSAEACRRAYFAKNTEASDYRNFPTQIFSKYPAPPCLLNSFKREQQYAARYCLSTY